GRENGGRQGRVDDGEVTRRLIARVFQAPQIGGKRLVVWVGSIRLDGGRYDIRSHKPRDVVYVAVRVIAGDAAIQPNHVGDAKVIVECRFDLLARKPWVALLHVADQAF